MQRYQKWITWLLLVGLLLSLLPAGTVFGAETQLPTIGTAAVSVPSISAPYTTHPTVFIVEDTYQIAFATNTTGLAWVEIAGVKYYDSLNGLLRWKSKYHKITVPQSALDAAKTYTIGFRSLTDRPSYDPAPGNAVSRTYPFDPIPQDRSPVFYCASDQHGDNTNALKISKYKAFDVYYFGGDYVSTLVEESSLKLLLDMTGSVTQGRKPTIYARGNHEIRGSKCEELANIAAFSEKTGAYYTVEMPGIFGIVLDSGEDKADNHEAYGGTTQFQPYRDAQTRWLREVLNSRVWEKYPVRMVFAHVPIGFNAQDIFEGPYKEWTELLDRMGISLLISGHKHYYGAYGPNSSKYKSDPNFSTLLMSDRENEGDAITYSASFVTVGPTAYKSETITDTLAVRATATFNLFNNAYVNPEAKALGNTSAPESGASVIASATKASVPAISAPYTLHPTVFAVEDGYQIIFPTDTTGMAWVEVGGTKYYDLNTGNMRYTSKYHSVRVPRVALDTARSYKVCYQSMVSREAYYPTHGSTVSRTYPFTPMADKKEPVILCLSDFRGLATEAKAVAGYKTFDALFVGGDYAYHGNTEANVKILLDTASALTSGTKPVFFTRGNREIRGNYAHLLEQMAPTSSTGRSYYTVEQADFFAIVLDSGEDKVDSHSAYGGTIDYETFRKEQTRWLSQVLAEGKWKDYPTRIAFCHMPFTRNNAEGVNAEFARWTELLNQMGITLLISGHSYSHALYAPNASGNVTKPTFTTMVSCDVDHADYKYSGSFVTLGAKNIKVESVSAAKKLLKTSTTPNLTAPNALTESDPYLMFDFVGDPISLDRYHSFVYGGINFDHKSNWDHDTNTTATTVSQGSLSFSPVDSTVSTVGVLSRPIGTAVKGQWSFKPLHYFTKAADFFQIRFKIDNAVATAADGTAKLRLDLDCLNDLDPSADVTRSYTRYEQSFKASDVVGKGYVTLTLPLNKADYLNFDFLALVHPQFVGLKSASGATAVFTIDYIYVGPQETLPKQEDHLFFDFTDTEADRLRYDSFTYGHANFDRASSWITYNGSPMSTIRDGALHVAVPVGNTDTSHSVRGYPGFSKVLHFVPGQKDVVQVRLRIRNAAATTEDGMVNFCINFDRNNSLTLSDGTSRTWTRVYLPFRLADVVNGDWFVLQTPITNWEYLQSEWINLIHPMFQNVTNASGKTAEFLIDYIYIGPEGKSPNAHTVTFCAEDGTVLEEHKVATGATVTYTGTLPTKAYDSHSHYRFAGWAAKDGSHPDLSNITDSLTLYPYFTPENHSYTEKLLAPPSCVSQGVKSLTCACGHSYREAVSPTGHTPGSIAAVPPTCTASGMSEGSYCTVCNAVIKAPAQIPALGHSGEVIPGYPAGCLTSGLSDGSRCRRCGLVLREQEILPRLGHSMTYTDMGSEHLVHCSRCNKSSTEAHSFTVGICICGKSENKEPIEDPTLKLNHSLNLASDISVNLLVFKPLLEGFDMSTVYVESTVETPEGATTLQLRPLDNGYYYYFTLDGLTAIQMNDEISSVLYGTKNGQTYRSPVDEYSIASYAYSQMNNPDRAESLKILCADLLRYGSAAQIFKSYRLDNLADRAMTDSHRAYLSNIDTVTFGNTNRVLNDLPNAPMTWAGKSLNLESKVALKFAFNPAAYTGEIAALTLRISYTDAYGNAKTATVADPVLYNPQLGYYVFTVDSLLAAELRAVVSVQIYAGNTPVSATLQYSPDTYGNGKTGTLLDLCKALFAYSDSAKAYFAP